jgi:hypothetical protein
MTFTIHNFLLEKVQHNKANFRDITLKILICMMRREQSSFLYPELFKRFRFKNVQVANFAILVVVESFKTEEEKVTHDVNLRQMFKSV